MADDDADDSHAALHPVPAGRAQFFEACPAPAAVVGFDGDVKDVNPAWLALTGWDQASVLGVPLVGFMHPEDLALSLGSSAGLRQGKLAGSWEGRLLCRDGSLRWASWEVTAQRDHERYFCVIRELTSEELRRQERFKVDFINMAAHELNTPLTPIQLALDTLDLRIDPVMGRDLKGNVTIVKRNFNRLRDLVQELLDAARIHAGRLPLDLQQTDLSHLARQAMEARREAPAEGNTRFSSHIQPDLVAVLDPARVRQVLDNYILCTLGYAAAGGHIELRVERKGPEAVVTVHGDGTVLTDEQRNQLFLPFPPLGGPDQSPGPASGLGLYMSRGIIELHGGRVEARSNENEGGLMLSFALPLDGPPAAGPTGRKEELRAGAVVGNARAPY